MYDGPDTSDYLGDVYHCSENDYLVCGKTGPFQWLLRLTPGGDLSDEFVGGYGYLHSVIEADNSDAVTTGEYQEALIGNRMLGVTRLNPDREVVWTQTYAAGSGYAIIELKEGDFIATGNGAAIRINENGDLVWRTFFSAIAYAMRETDDGIVMAGTTTIENRRYGWLRKLDFDGNVIWTQQYAIANRSLEFRDISALPEGGFGVAGFTRFDDERGEPDGDYMLYKIDAEGNEAFSTTVQLDGGRHYCYGMRRLSDGGFVFVGSRITPPAGWWLPRNYIPFAVRTTPQGVVRWTLEFNDGSLRESGNYLNSVIVQDNDVIVAAGSLLNRDQALMSDGLLVRLEPAILGPEFIYRLPEDSLQTVLMGNSIRFIIRARDQQGYELGYQWMMDGTRLGQDTTELIQFDSLGAFSVICQATSGDWAVGIGWMVNVRDLFIASNSPDTLSLSLRRGTSQTFSLDTVRAVEGDPVQYQWTLIDLNNFEREDVGSETHATVDFLRSGNYQMEGLAYRGESRDNVIWTIAVRSAILDFWPRDLNLSVLPDSLVNFGVLPFNPESDSLSYAWYLDGELIGQDSAVGWWFAPLDSQPGRITYAVSAIVMDGAEGDTVRWEVTVREPARVGKLRSGQVDKWGLLSVSPNPFNSTTTIRYSTSGDAYPTRLTVHDLTGREVARLVDGRAQQAGPYAVRLDGKDLPAGVYIVRLESKQGVKMQKVVLVR